MFRRKGNRLGIKELYQKNNWYFITLVEAHRRCIFSSVQSRGIACNPTVEIKQNIVSNVDKNQEQNKIVVPPHSELQATPQLNESTPVLTEIGKIIESNWFYLETLFSDISLKDFLIMPNHIHFILELGNNPSWRNAKKPTDLGNIVKALKSKSVVDSKKLGIFDDSTFWQRSYHDHIIRDESELVRIREYIKNNPAQWELDILNPINEKKYKEKYTKT
jgi:REP element-mobilizing transposase RayT